MPSEARAGRLYGVGVGPGDPELLTRKAERILRQVDVVAVPKRGPRDRGYAFEIVASLLDPGRQEILDLVFPMTRDRERLEAAWESHVEALARRLRDGRDCAFITEGDPFLYSTFIPLWERLRARCPEVPVEAVPGVSSVTAASCRAGLPLASGGERVAILPAVPEDPGALRGIAAAFDTVVVMKAGARGREILDAWEDGGLAGGRILGVRRATTPSEAIAEGPEAVAALEPDYFSLFLLRGAAGRAAEGGAPPAPGVYFIGAGPGAPDLITLRGREILGAADVVVYADSLVHPDLLRFAAPAAEVHGSSRLTLEEQVALMREAVAAGRVVARLHSGDPALFGAIQEQMAALAAAGVPCRVVPGVTAATAAAAALGVELSVPGVAQTVILSRAAGRTPVPEREALRRLARHRATLCLYLSAGLLETAVAELLAGGYPPGTPAALAHRVSWPDERLVRCRLHELPERAAREGIRNQAVVLVGEALAYPGAAGGPAARSRLYHPGFGHAFRRAGGGEGEA